TLVERAENDRTQHSNHFNDWPEFIVLDVNTGLRCQEMLFLEFSDIDWQSGVLHVRNKKHLSFSPKGRKERRVPLNEPAMSAVRSMLKKKHEKGDLVFHQQDGLRWKLVLESFRSLLKRCGFKRVDIHALAPYVRSTSRTTRSRYGCDPRFARTPQRDAHGKALCAPGTKQP